MTNYILEQTKDINFNTIEEPFKKLGDIITEAAKKHLSQIPDKQRKDFIDEPTWELMEQREHLIAQGKGTQVEELNKTIKESIRKLRQN